MLEIKMNIQSGDSVIFCSVDPVKYPDTPKTKVTILGKSPHGPKKWYFQKPNGASDSTDERFLLPIEAALNETTN